MDELKTLRELKNENEKLAKRWAMEEAIEKLIDRVNEITARLNRLAE